jgi:hypothetical protein
MKYAEIPEYFAREGHYAFPTSVGKPICAYVWIDMLMWFNEKTHLRFHLGV